MVAGMQVSVDLSEVHALARDWERHADEAPAKARAIVQRGGHAVVAGSQLRAPVDTGALRGSISLDETHGGLGFVVGPTVDYGDYVERGTSRMNAQPYLGPTYDRELPKLERGLQSLAASGLRRR